MQFFCATYWEIFSQCGHDFWLLKNFVLGFMKSLNQKFIFEFDISGRICVLCDSNLVSDHLSPVVLNLFQHPKSRYIRTYCVYAYLFFPLFSLRALEPITWWTYFDYHIPRKLNMFWPIFVLWKITFWQLLPLLCEMISYCHNRFPFSCYPGKHLGLLMMSVY